jgi:hypothetical protein
MKHIALFEKFLNESSIKPINDIKGGIYKGKIVRGFH